MKTTDELIRETLGDVNVKIPSLIEKLEKSIETKNEEVKDILEIAKSLKKTMESFAESIDENACHGSDAVAAAEEEIRFFFEPRDLCDRIR